MEKSHASVPFTSVYRQFFTTMLQALSRAPTCFERERKLGPLQVLLTMQAAHFAGSHAGGQSWENALESVASSLGDESGWGTRFSVSRTAFHQAVKKVDDADQVRLWEMCRPLFPAGMGATVSELHGIRFAHVDGTQVRTPRSAELVEKVGVQTNGPSPSASSPSRTARVEPVTSPPASLRYSPSVNADDSTKPDGPSKPGSATPNNSSPCAACAAPPCTACDSKSSPSSSSCRRLLRCASELPTT